MAGTNPASKFVQTNYTLQDSATYKANIDSDINVMKQIAAAFAPHAQDSPNMTIKVDAGSILYGSNIVSQNAQNTGTITAPSTYPRLDLVVIDAATAAVSVITGTEAVSPSLPAIPDLKIPIAQISLTVGQSSITNSNITDLRMGGGGSPTAAIAIQGDFKNLQASATGTNANISVTADQIVVFNASNLGILLSTVSLTIVCSNSGVNGLDTGTLATSTWYSVWVIYNPTTQTKAGLISLSATAPTLPSGYTYYARVGWIRTDSSNKYPLSFVQYGRTVQYKVGGGNVSALPLMASDSAGSMSTPTWASVSVSNFVPTTASKIKVIGNTANGNMMIAPNNSYGAYNSTSNPPYAELGTVSGAVYFSLVVEMILESTNIYWANGGSGYLRCIGWDDNL